jgi:hypothetical protein
MFRNRGDARGQQQLLASQRKFAEDVLKATAPMLTGQDDAPARKNGSTAK